MAFGEPGKLAYAQALACALAYLALSHHDRVGALAFSDAVLARLPVGRRGEQWNALRQFVAGLSPGGATDFAKIPPALAGPSGLRGLVVILSDFSPAEAFAAGLRRLARCPVRVVAIQIQSPQEADPDLEGEIQLTDLETGETRGGWIGPEQRSAYRVALAGHEARLAGVCRESGIRHIPISTAVSIVSCLQAALVRAGILRREGS
jgi:uncharacterized protein (DUF58 family)